MHSRVHSLHVLPAGCFSPLVIQEGGIHCLQVVLSHTPYRELAKTLGDKPVVISGKGASDVAAAYGFKRAVTTAQLSAQFPTAVPFCHEPGEPAAMPLCYRSILPPQQHELKRI